MNKAQEKILGNILTQEELVEAKKSFPKDISDENIFDYLIGKGIIFAVDWSGEEKDGDIGNFFQHRLEQENITLEPKKIYNNLINKINAGDIDRGDAVLFILESFNKILKKQDVKIMLLDFGNDTYNILLVSNEKEKILRKIKDKFWNFSTFGSKKKEILYIATCVCGEEAVWQLKETEQSPFDEYCEKCGKQLFDKNGKELVPLEKEYV